ncbi:MAG: hypothetical protein B7Z08_00035 [Sphingomonadales bacterium 32-68-7]|nr:MAG: hypothetical protein B7Z08_00035 [Sphingomonadales bacterium 32-68-7]
MAGFGCRARVAQFVLALLASLLIATPAHAWWDTEWSYRKPVTIDTTASGVNVSGTLGRTVVLIRLHSGNFTFTEALENGADLRIVDSDDQTPLPYHIERYNSADGLATVWVSVPTLNGGEKRQLWLYFGNPNASVGDDVAGTFDPDYMAVYHFGENAGQPVADNTANANNAAGGVPGVNDNGIVGRSARFPGQGQITINASPSLAMPAGAPFTFSAWVKPDQLAGDAALFSRGPLVIGANAGIPYVAIGAASARAGAPLRQGEWNHLAVTADAGTIRIYVDGVEAGAASAQLPALDGAILLGGAPGRPFTGELDEVRLSKVARPAAMLMAVANAEGPSGSLVNVSETAEKQGGGGGVLGFVLSKIHGLDIGIIALCMVLLALAIWLMVSKMRYLNAAERGNAVFKRRFEALHEELTPIAAIPGISKEEADFIAKTPLGRLYETGIEELQVRQRLRGARPLSGEAVEAMRAAVDAVVVAENQKLDKWMVILTIAISGGPTTSTAGSPRSPTRCACSSTG